MGAAPSDLFSPIDIGDLTLSNRMVMPAMTRSRAGPGEAQGALNAEYYAQRASAGLIVTEGSQVSQQGMGYIRTPGIFSPAQIAGWRLVTDAVHAAGGRIVLQLWHVGRASHPEFQGGGLPVAPSAVRPDATVYTSKGMQPIPTPRALEETEIADVVAQFGQGAQNAKAAGFDGVQIHGGNGYLVDQFLRDGSNQRDDLYGGSLAKRARFPLEVTQAAIDVWGKDRVGYKMTPWSTMLSAFDSNPVATFTYLTEALDDMGVASLEIVEREHDPNRPDGVRLIPVVREKFSRRLIVGGGYDVEKAERTIAAGQADLVAFGTLFLANPDLPRRFRDKAPLNTPDASRFYQGEGKGYTDYPTWDGRAVNV